MNDEFPMTNDVGMTKDEGPDARVIRRSSLRTRTRWTQNIAFWIFRLATYFVLACASYIFLDIAIKGSRTVFTTTAPFVNVAFLTEPPCLVTGFIPGHPVDAAELRAAPLLDDVAMALRTVHEGKALPSRFDAFAIVEAYRVTAARRGARIPASYGELAAGARAIQGALTGPEHVPVACHNDLLTANFLFDGTRTRIVDWEYAGMGDRYFDLGNLSVNNGFADADDEALLAAYWGAPCTERRFASLRLMRIMSDFREAMWGVVQTAISELDFDFAAYAGEHLERVAAGLADPRVPTWLEDARGDQP